MLLYDYQGAPSPRRVRIYLAEKGISVPTEQVDLRATAQFSEAFRRVNPDCVVPFLVLDDGATIAESLAICRYFEVLHPAPPLFGTTALEQATVEMWNRRIEFDGYLAVAEGFRNATPGFKGRALPGPVGFEQIEALAVRGRRRVELFFEQLNERFARSEYVAGPVYTVADITALAAVDFAGWMRMRPGERHPHLRRWHAQVSARPSAGA